jgi:hypothetical protein
MKKIKLTDEQKEKLLRPNLYMSAVFGEGIEWSVYCYAEETIDFNELNGPLPSGKNGWDRKKEIDEIQNEPGFFFIDETAVEIAKNTEDAAYDEMSCDDCVGSGYIYVHYDPETQIFSSSVERYLRFSEDSEYMKTFEEWGNTQPQYPWQKFTYLKKLLDPEFIEKYKNEGEDGVFELIYNGGGDSGQIEEPVDLPQDIEYLGYEIIDVYHSGWENNEGADGRIIINFNEKTISLYHQHYYEEGETVELEKYQLV